MFSKTFYLYRSCRSIVLPSPQNTFQGSVRDAKTRRAAVLVFFDRGRCGRRAAPWQQRRRSGQKILGLNVSYSQIDDFEDKLNKSH